ncbi:MAG: prepilin-type N-terminal cleavage/methylation domain-containing protein, partial [Phycisphaerales bacterium]|nr:prepilin-type N-terminal cleavage/methylation domain-containing protein [Phycisphaerales bacterium]
MNRFRRPFPKRGFSLIELLMAIFILGIGLISIAALFPAGVMLQQRAEDELNGPLVAAHALELLRSRLSSDDFGSWWDYIDAQTDWEGGEAAKLDA